MDSPSSVFSFLTFLIFVSSCFGTFWVKNQRIPQQATKPDPCDVDRPMMTCEFEDNLQHCWQKLKGSGHREDKIRSCIDCVTAVGNKCRDDYMCLKLFWTAHIGGFCDDCAAFVSNCETQRCWDLSMEQTLIKNQASTAISEEEMKRLQEMDPFPVPKPHKGRPIQRGPRK